MFVDQYKGTHRIRFGELEDTENLRLMANSLPWEFSSQVSRVANANELPILAEGTGLLGSTRVNTPQGSAKIEDLTVGQEILTASNQKARVKHILSVERPHKALRIRAPYFGANQDVIIAENHYLRFTSEIAEYMFGQPCVYVPAWALKDNAKVLHHDLQKTDLMYHLQIDCGEDLAIGNCGVAAFRSGIETSEKRLLNDAEARSFMMERRIGQYN